MFIENKYYKWYYNIVDAARSRALEGYSENHHILPKCLGGTNDKNNLVRLTAREHFLCHWLLTKMTSGKQRYKMLHAAWQMMICDSNSKNKRYRPPARIYEKIRIQRNIELKSIRGPEHPHYGKPGNRKGIPTSDATKLLLSSIKKGKPTWNKGIPRDEITKQKISVTRKERSSDPTWNIRPPCSAEKAEKIRVANLGKKWVHNLDLKMRKYLPEMEAMQHIDFGWLPGKGKF